MKFSNKLYKNRKMFTNCFKFTIVGVLQSRFNLVLFCQPWSNVLFPSREVIFTFHHKIFIKFQTTSGEDVRDFTKLLRNKLMSRKKKNSRLGYLPVHSLDAETPESPSLSPGRSVSRQVDDWKLSYFFSSIIPCAGDDRKTGCSEFSFIRNWY